MQVMTSLKSLSQAPESNKIMFFFFFIITHKTALCNYMTHHSFFFLVSFGLLRADPSKNVSCCISRSLTLRIHSCQFAHRLLHSAPTKSDVSTLSFMWRHANKLPVGDGSISDLKDLRTRRDSYSDKTGRKWCQTCCPKRPVLIGTREWLKWLRQRESSRQDANIVEWIKLDCDSSSC